MRWLKLAEIETSKETIVWTQLEPNFKPNITAEVQSFPFISACLIKIKSLLASVKIRWSTWRKQTKGNLIKGIPLEVWNLMYLLKPYYSWYFCYLYLVNQWWELNSASISFSSQLQDLVFPTLQSLGCVPMQVIGECKFYGIFFCLIQQVQRSNLGEKLS